MSTCICSSNGNPNYCKERKCDSGYLYYLKIKLTYVTFRIREFLNDNIQEIQEKGIRVGISWGDPPYLVFFDQKSVPLLNNILQSIDTEWSEILSFHIETEYNTELNK